MTDAEKSGWKQRGRPFSPGTSGNPKGKPKDARNRATLAAEALLDGEAEALTRIVIAKALDGDPTALRLCLDRILPVRRDRTVQLSLPSVKGAPDAVAASRAILVAVLSGEITPAEGIEIAKVLEVHLRAIEAEDLERRLAALEASAHR